MPRKLSSWIDGFTQYTEKTGSPILFRRWAAIYTIAAALERKVHVQTTLGTLYPNLYIILVGPAGAGKTVSTSIAHDLLHSLEDHHIAPTSVTKASLMDALKEAERKIVRPQDVPPVHTFNSLAVISNELGVLIPAYENEIINALTDIYDCKRYKERKRTAKLELEIPNPQLNFIAATTPSYLNNLMPEGAWDQGFISRTFLIYSGHSQAVDLFEAQSHDEKLRAALISDLKEIGNLWGRVTFSAEAIEAFRSWMLAKEEPAPTHPKLQHYNSRRRAHLLKLCTIASAATSSSFEVTLENYAEAMDWMMEAEASMEDIFKSMTMGASTRVMDECWHFAYERWKRDKNLIPEPLIYEFIAQRAPAHEVGRILEVMTRSGIFVAKSVAGVGLCYEVRPRR